MRKVSTHAAPASLCYTDMCTALRSLSTTGAPAGGRRKQKPVLYPEDGGVFVTRMNGELLR